MLVKKITILVLADPSDPHLSLLGELRETANVVIGNAAPTFAQDAPNAEVLFNWSGSLPLMREVFRTCRCLRWIHSRSVGLERTLFPELIASDVTLTNGKGVFSPSLGEFALGAIL